MDWSIEFFPFFPLPVLLALAALSVLTLFLSAIGRRRGVLLRTVFFLSVLTALANPSIRQEERRPLSNIAVIAVDESSSMKLAGRAERARELEANLKQELAKLPNVEVKTIHAKRSQAPGGGGGGEVTNLLSAMDSQLTEVPQARIAGFFLITDGQVHDVPQDPASLGFGSPVHALIAGAQNEKDTRIEVVSVPRFGLVGTRHYAEVKAEWNGAEPAPAEARFTVRRAQGGAEPFTAPYGQIVRIPIYFEHAGPNLLEVELQPVPGELTAVNNKAIIQTQGVRENLRVLLVSGEPHAGERTWRNLLRSDAAVDLVHFTILRPPEKHDGTPIDQLSLIAFPTRELFAEKLNQFDLIIFDRYQRRAVLPMVYLDNVARYVEQGGAVLIAAGADYASPTSLARTPLGAVLPARPTGRVVEEAFQPTVTPSGERHPVTTDLPGSPKAEGAKPAWGRWFRVVDSQPESGSVLMTGAEGKPLLVLDRRGKGRVALLLSDHAWLWARGYEGGGPHVDLLRRLAHWLMKEPDLEEEALRASAKADAITIERRTVKDTLGQAKVTTPSGGTLQVALEPKAPGRFVKTIPAEEPGLYRISMDGLSAFAVAGEMDSPEFRKVVATREALAPVLDATGGGGFYLGGTAGAQKQPVPQVSLIRSGYRYHGSSWMGLKARDAYEIKAVSYTPLIGGLAALLAALSLLALTWWREGR